MRNRKKPTLWVLLLLNFDIKIYWGYQFWLFRKDQRYVYFIWLYSNISSFTSYTYYNNKAKIVFENSLLDFHRFIQRFIKKKISTHRKVILLGARIQYIFPAKNHNPCINSMKKDKQKNEDKNINMKNHYWMYNQTIIIRIQIG